MALILLSHCSVVVSRLEHCQDRDLNPGQHFEKHEHFPCAILTHFLLTIAFQLNKLGYGKQLIDFFKVSTSSIIVKYAIFVPICKPACSHQLNTIAPRKSKFNGIAHNQGVGTNKVKPLKYLELFLVLPQMASNNTFLNIGRPQPLF